MTANHVPSGETFLALTQLERDEIDNRAVREAWLRYIGSIPLTIEQQIGRGEVFFSALDLAETVLGPKRLDGWRVSFSSEGGPYTVTLTVRHVSTDQPANMTATHPGSLTLAMTSVLSELA